MKKISIAIIISMCFSLISFGKEVDQCLENAKSQSGMNRCEGINLEKADAELNRVYKLIQKAYKNDVAFLSKLKKSQRIWLKLRDADMEMRFPPADERHQYGSVFPMCHAAIETTLILQRVEYLKQWLVGVEEGDVCSGSIMRPDQIRKAIK